MVEFVTAANRTVGAKQWRACEREIADGVERLVANEFIGKPQALGVENAVIGHDKRVFECRPKGVAGAPQLGYVAHESKGAGARDLLAEAVRRHVERNGLSADHRV